MSRDQDIPGLGKDSERLRHNPSVALSELPLSSEDYFVWTRVDGHTTIHDILLMVGFPRTKTIEILRRLRDLGALLGEGESPEQAAARVARAAAASAAPDPNRRARPRAAERRVSAPATTTSAGNAAAGGSPLAALAPLSAQERAAFDEEVELDDARKIRIVSVLRSFTDSDHFTILGVTTEADQRTLKRAYFKLSKEFHPDRYYGKHLGSFGPWLTDIFHRLKTAYEVLSNDDKRRQYERRLAGGDQRQAQSKAEYGVELFERACRTQASGDLTRAMVLFQAAIRLDEQAAYLSRAASCATAAGEAEQAVDFARRATALEPANPSLHRVLAEAQVAAGDLDGARATLEAALALKTENDALAAGLRADLERIRARLGSRIS
ncbi:DnaJ domain-containing protein [Haliangium sp.]|uniref:J domain-containing protein n=1 Tax=Haliangium sp. TaxID=2663208 RepID=UPI003D13C187